MPKLDGTWNRPAIFTLSIRNHPSFMPWKRNLDFRSQIQINVGIVTRFQTISSISLLIRYLPIESDH